jgi:hypothetical protein
LFAADACRRTVSERSFSPTTWNCSVSMPSVIEALPSAVRTAL